MKKFDLTDFEITKTDISKLTGGICKCKIMIPGGPGLPDTVSWGTSAQSRVPKPPTEDGFTA